MKQLISIIFLFLLLAPNIAHAQDCPGSLPTSLSIGVTAHVKAGNQLSMRYAPEWGDIITTLPENADFTILDSPVCGRENGLRWWFVDWNGTRGWIAEGNLEEAWIDLPSVPMFLTVGEEPEATPIPPTSTPQPTSGIQFNDVQYVAEDNGVRFWLDMSVTDYANRDLSIYLWFVDTETNDYLQNPDAHENYINDTGKLFLNHDLQPCCQSVTYGIGDIQMFMPYDQLPDGDYSFYPAVTLYDENLELVAKQSFADVHIAVDGSTSSDASFHQIEYQFAEEGIWFLIDATITDHYGENLRLYLWFIDDATGEFIKNPIASDTHRSAQNSLLIKEKIIPLNTHQNYTGNDLSLYIPYYEFPRKFNNYTPFVTLYDADLNEIAQRHFDDVVIQASEQPLPQSGILIRDITYTFEEDGVNFYVDMDTIGFAGQPLEVIAFFRDYNDNYLHSALPIDDYYNTDEGSIIGFNTIEPCCTTQQAFTDENRVEIYVPYNVFPVGTYSYYPVISVQRAGESEGITSRAFREKAIEVLGDEPPAGYIVNYKIDELYGAHPLNNNGMANSGPEWDDLLLIYSLYEIDHDGTLIPGDQRYWTQWVWPRTVHTEDFETILLDVLADSNLVVRMEFNEVVDLEATKDAVDGLRDASKAVRRGARFLPRLFRIAAKSAARYVNGMLLFYDIMAFFEKDRLFHTYERVITPDELLSLYRSTGAIGELWHTETEAMRGNYYGYEITHSFWLYGYARHREWQG